jgi:hypothetical protein
MGRGACCDAMRALPVHVLQSIGTIQKMSDKNTVETAASQVIGFEAELENAGEAKTGGDLLA